MTGLNYVQVTGTWADSSGLPVSGTVTFTPSQTIYASGLPLVTPGVPVTAQVSAGVLRSASGGEVQLLATDNAGLSIQGGSSMWFWTATVAITSGVSTEKDSWDFPLPYSAQPVDLYATKNLVPASWPNPMTSPGDMIAGGALGSAERIPGNSTTAREFLVSQGTGSAAQVPSFGALQAGDVPSLPYAPTASPALTGTPTAPTATALTDDTQVATTAYADAAVAVEASRAGAAEALKAPLASPVLTGSPTAPTQTSADNSTKLATTAFVATAAGTALSAAETYAATQAAAAQVNAIAASLPTLAQASVSASGTLALDTLTTVTAATALTMTLPASVTGALIVVERESASAASVAVTGNIRGVAAQTVTLSLASESEMFFGYGGSWWPAAGHKTLGSLDGHYLYAPAPSGDTSGATDAAAVNALLSSGAKVILRPCTSSAPYWINATLKVSGYGALQGAGEFATWVKMAAGANLASMVANDAYLNNATTSGNPVTVSDLALDGNKANNPSAGDAVILLTYRSQVRDVYITNPNGHGVTFSDTNLAGAVISNSAVENRAMRVTVDNPGGRGIWVKDTGVSGKCTDGYIMDCVVNTPAGDYAIRNERSAGWFMTNNHVYACQQGGIYLDQFWDTFAYGNEVDGYGQAAGANTYIGINIQNVITGREGALYDNQCSTIEQAATSYRYYSVRAPAVTVGMILHDNFAHKDSGSGASSVAYNFVASSGGALTVYGQGNKLDGPATAYANSGGGTITFADVPPGSSSWPQTTLGDISYAAAFNVPARLAGNTAATRKFLRQLGNGTVSAAPAWDTLQAGDIPDLSAAYDAAGAATAVANAVTAELGTANGIATLDSGTHVPVAQLPAATTGARGAVQLDGTASDIQPAGQSAAAGSSGEAADAKHVHPPGSSFLCAPTQYAPGSRATNSTTSTTMSAVSSANINTGSFTAPASGSVVVTASLLCSTATAGNHIGLALAAHGTVSPVVSNDIILTTGTTNAVYETVQFIVTGLTAGTAYNFDLLFSAPDGTSVSVFSLGQTGVTPPNASGAPTTMTVQAV